MRKTILILFSLFIAVNGSDYCKLKCDRGKHTVCKRNPCGAGSACGKNYDPAPMDDNARKYILNQHNKLRQKVANGQDTRGGNGEASNIAVLQYDKELEYVAKCWADNCEFKHDDCRATETFPAVGQNLYSSSSSEAINPGNELDKACDKWYGEIQDTTASIIDSFPMNPGVMIGHFTQLVWAKTTHIGCARAIYGPGSRYAYNLILVCNYGPSGNYVNQPVYKRGKACSECGSLKCSTKYPGLCGDPEPIESNTWTPPGGAGGQNTGTGLSFGTSGNTTAAAIPTRGSAAMMGLPILFCLRVLL